jgi:hypothetical protein
MQKLNFADFTFSSLSGQGSQGSRSLSYLVGLVDSASHKISDVLPAKRILSYFYEAEEQCSNAYELEKSESFFTRFFPGGYHPQTPCMLANAWSPIGGMLERGFAPEVLNREPTRVLATATGIWRPPIIDRGSGIESAITVEELFWAIMAEVSARARDRRMWINIIARPGWSYDAAIGSLPDWPPEEVAKAGRVLWKRTPEKK